jgi:hypothetical protein
MGAYHFREKSNYLLPIYIDYFTTEQKGAPTGTRTPVLALRGLRPGPLDDGGILAGRIVSWRSSPVKPARIRQR